MKELAAFLYLLLVMAKTDADLTTEQMLQVIKDFNAGKRYEYVQIKHHIGASIKITNSESR